MKTTFLILLTFISFIQLSSGQELKVKYGKISPEDLAMKVYAPDTDAVAIVLSETGWVTYDVRQEKYPLMEERHVVIKILKEAGIDEYGNAEIDYYSENNYSKVGDIKGIVHLPDGTEIRIDNSQMFDEKTNDFWSSKRIAFPKLIPGAIIEYQYTILSSGVFEPVDWFFQKNIPIVYSELKTKLPEWFEYVILTQGLPVDHSEKEITTENLQVSGFSRGSTAFEQSQLVQAAIPVKFVNNTFINKDVPALKEECCITTMHDYYSRIRFRLNAYQFPSRPREPVMNTWKKLAEELYDVPEWGGQFRNKRPGELVLEAAGINPASASNQMEVAQKLYDYLNHNIQWNGYYSIGLGKDINSILKARSGSSGELNKMMCAALLQSGIKAKPVLVSTRDHGKLIELYPFTDQFNHMVVMATIDGKETWMDIGDKNLPLGLLRPEVLNMRGWIVDEDLPEWIDMLLAESKSVYLIKGGINNEGNLNGELEARFTGYHALQQRIKAGADKEKFGADLIVSGNNSLKISDIELINVKETAMPFKLKAKILDQPIATATPDKIYISSLFPAGLNELPFKLEERVYPIEMNYPEDISIILDLMLPEGYVVETLPEPIRFVTENGGIQVTYNASQIPGKVNVTMKYIIKQLHFHPTEYDGLKAIYNERRQKFNEQIVLSKI